MSAISDKIRGRVDEAAQALSEYADTVIVIIHSANTEEDGIEQSYTATRGSQYTRYAILKEKVLAWEQYIRTYADIQQKRDMKP